MSAQGTTTIIDNESPQVGELNYLPLTRRAEPTSGKATSSTNEDNPVTGPGTLYMPFLPR